MATISSGTTNSGQIISSGSTLTVAAGGTIVNYTILNGGSAVVSGVDNGTTISAGGQELVISGGTATGDQIYGTLTVSNTPSTATDETVYAGGELFLTGSVSADATTIAGGTVILDSTNAGLTGGVSFTGSGGVLSSIPMSKAPAGVTGVISGFGVGDEILVGGGTAVALTSGTTVSGGNTLEVITADYTFTSKSTITTISESFTFASNALETYTLAPTTGAGTAVIGVSTITTVTGAINGGTVLSGVTATVETGGSVTSDTVAAGGTALISGTDNNATIALGGTATIFGTASGDIISGTETVSGSDTGNTIALGGTEIVTGSASGGLIFGTEILSGTASNLTLNGGTLELASSTASLTGGLSFTGASTLEETALAATGAGVGALITGFGAGDVIDLSAIGTGATLTSATSGANAVISISGGSTEGSVVESFTFANAAGSIFSLGSISGGESLTIVNPVITVSGTSTGDVASAGYELKVLTGGTEVSGQILSGGSGLISGTDQGSTIAVGGTETVFSGGSASGDIVFGTQIVSGTAGSETVGATGTVTAASGGTVSSILLSGGGLELASGASLSGGITFAGGATLKEDGLTSPTALITGFDTTDSIDLSAIGTGAIITSTIADGDTVLTISGGSGEGGADITMTMAGTGNIYALGKDAAGTGEMLTEVPLLTSFTAGDIVVGVVGDDNDTADYGDNQAAPIALEEYTASGQLVGEMVLADNNTTLANGTVEYGISGEYGSSSEGILQLAGDGESLVIAGYNVNYTDYNTAEEAGGINNYGTAALAQTTSLTDQDTLTPVARVIADIGYTGTVDTSTALYNVFNTNNPRSVATVNGKVFYISGQGVKGDTTGGLFVAGDGDSSATAVDNTNDTREVEIYNGTLYLSQNSSTGTSNISTFGDLPSGEATPTILPGINLTITLTAAQENSVNGTAVGTSVALSPEQYFFANATTLYVADSGDPKAGTLGDGGLQKWTLNTTSGQWQLDYTLSDGLNLVKDSAASGTTGLIGLTGVLNADGTVTFYATNATLGDLDQTYVYTITDTVSATTPGADEAFTVVTTAAADTNDRGISLAPSAPTDVTIASGQASAGLTVSAGSTVTVAQGGTLSAAVILSGGAAYVSGTDSGSLIVADGTETVYAGGSASGDNVYGTQIVSGTVSGETVYYGATLEVAAGGTATAITTEVNGVVEVSGTLTGLTLSGGGATLDEAGASLSGVTFAGTAEIAELTAGTSITGVISGFVLGDGIDLEQVGSGAVLTSAIVGGNTVETVTSGGVSQSFTLAGQYVPGEITLIADGNGGEAIAIGGSTITGTQEVTSGQYGADITVASGALLLVDAGGTVTADTILAGGNAEISGIASADVIAGSETVATGGTVTAETVTSGTLVLNNGADAGNITLTGGTLELASGATLGGALALGNAATLVLEGTTAPVAVISGFVAGDVIDITAMTTGATLTSGTSDGNTIETVTSGGVSESFTFAGTSYGSGYFVLDQNAAGDTLTTKPVTSAVVSSGATSTGYIVTSGFTLDVLTGGTAVSATVLSGGTANISGTDSGAIISSGGSIIISSGGAETGATILAGGTETLIGPDSATGDNVYGLQQITSANGATGTTLSDETIHGGGEVDIFFKTNTLENSTILSGGLFAINGNASGTDLTLAGGTIEFESPKANLTGTLDFTSGTLLISGAVISAGFGDLATIENFGAGDVIELAGFGSGVLSTSTALGNTIETVTSGSVSESFTFASASSFSLLTLTGGGVELLANTSVVNSGTVTGGTIGSGQEQLVTSGATAAGTTITNGGTQVVTNGGTVTGASVEQGSTQVISSGGTAIDTTVGDPSVQIVSAGATASNTTLTSGGEQDVSGSVISTTVENGGNEVLYTGGTATGVVINGGGTLTLDGGTVSGTTLAIGATVIDQQITYQSGMTGTITGSDLLVSTAGGTEVFDLQVVDDDAGGIVNVTAAPDGHSLEIALCFYPGTGIATPQGARAVETLRPGDLVLTANGALPVRWIGQSHIDTRFGDKRRSLPVRITAGALGGGLPRRDLLLSPGHAVFLDGILAHASALVNGETIIQEHAVPQQFTYYHVELATHELLLAEGVQAESFVDNVDRMHFHNWDEREAPRAPIAEMPYPRARAQRQLPQSVRRMLAVAKRA